MKISALKGTKDILPKEQKLRDYIQKTILETYTANGFERITTPILEDIENLDKSDGGDNLNLIFKILKRGEKLQTILNKFPIDEVSLSDIGLRYDLTLPLTRFFAANRNNLQYPFKSIQMDKVFRAEHPQKGRSREFIQCDIDIIGDASMNAEVELINVTATALQNIGITDFTININDRKVLRALLENIGFASESLDSVCITFDKLDKIGIDGVAAELTEKQCPSNGIKSLVDLVQNSNLTLDDVAVKCSDPSVADSLKYIISTVQKISGGKYQIKYSPSLVRGQGYYTGTIFEVTSPKFSGAIAGGGRYDNLINKFIGVSVPSVGFSIGFERICNILLDNDYQIPGLKEKCALLYDEETDFVQVLTMADKLRKDYNVTILHKNKKIGPMYDMLEKQGYTKFAQFKDNELLLK